MLLTPKELHDLTGYARRSAQLRWLTDHGWKFEVDRYGVPKVLRAEMERKMLGTTQPRTRELNLKAIKKKAA